MTFNTTNQPAGCETNVGRNTAFLGTVLLVNTSCGIFIGGCRTSGETAGQLEGLVLTTVLDLVVVMQRSYMFPYY